MVKMSFFYAKILSARFGNFFCKQQKREIHNFVKQSSYTSSSLLAKGNEHCQNCTKGQFLSTSNKGIAKSDDNNQTETQTGKTTSGHHKTVNAKELLHDSVDPTPQRDHEMPEFPSDARESRKSQLAWKRSQIKHSYRPRVDPKETSILLFPGQGTQFVGMGKELLNYPNVEEMYSMASDILGYDLLDLCLNGPIEKLNKTVHCQPAILVTSLAAVEKVKHTHPWMIEHCITAAGFSIGEYAALVFAGALSYSDAVQVVKVRAEAMQKASEMVPSGMMTVFQNHRTKLKFACHTAKHYCADRMNIERPVCEVANYLYPECKVLGGHIQALDFIEQNAKEFNILRTKRIPVSGAFHTSLMHPAKSDLRDAIKNIQIKTPIIPVHSNVNTYKYQDPNIIERLLIEQIYKPLKWEQIMQNVYARPNSNDYPFTLELGPGKQLGSILSKVNRKALAQYESVIV